MANARFPNLFIVGAPKCGTTALSHYLAGHPMIFMSEQSGAKEPNYFCPDLNHPLVMFPYCIRSIEGYLDLFKDCSEDIRYRGDASVGYLYSQLAIPEILRQVPKAHLIVMLRNPVEIVEALHNTYLRLGGEIASFEKAWRLQDSRMAGRNLPYPFDTGHILQYGEIGKLGKQMNRLFATANRSQIFIGLYEDFAKDPASIYRRLLKWLDLPDDFRLDFPKLNPREIRRLPRLEVGLLWLRRQRQKLGLPGGLGIHALIDRFNKKHVREPLRPAFRHELCDYFRDDVALLSRLLGRDLSHWLD